MADLTRVLAALGRGKWWESWKVLLGLATLYAAVAVLGAVFGIAGIDPDQGHAGGFAALAFVLLALVAVATFFAAVVGAFFLRNGRAKTPVSVALILAGSVVYWSSGWFEGFLPVFVIGAVAGTLGLYEEHIE